MVLLPQGSSSTDNGITRIVYGYRSGDPSVNDADREETIQQFAKVALSASSSKRIRRVKPLAGGFALYYVPVGMATMADTIYTQQLAALASLRNLWRTVLDPAMETAKNIGSDIAKFAAGLPKWILPLAVVFAGLWTLSIFKDHR
jgi:hypothetical protein